MLIFYDLSYTDAGWDSSGKESSTCALNDCRYHWLLRGMWSWPEKPRQRKWVTIKGTPTGKGYDTVEPCWIGPFSLEVPSDTGDACYPMLLYRAGEKERGGFWKACFLQELCTDHHHLSGHKTGPVWKAGFSFTQRGIPDAQRVIRTQTGGAGIILFDEAPVANRKGPAREAEPRRAARYSTSTRSRVAQPESLLSAEGRPLPDIRSQAESRDGGSRDELR